MRLQTEDFGIYEADFVLPEEQAITADIVPKFVKSGIGGAPSGLCAFWRLPPSCPALFSLSGDLNRASRKKTT